MGGSVSAKLTLRLDSLLIQQAKIYAGQHKKSVSQLVGEFFALLGAPMEPSSSVVRPLTRSLRGVLKKTNLSKRDYQHYLEKKYL
jgi:hypothetical protein